MSNPLLQAFSQAWADRDIDRLIDLFSPDAAYQASVGPEPGFTAKGHEEIRALIQTMFDLDHGARSETSEPIVFEGGAFWTWRYVLDDGSVEIGCDLLRFRDGKIVLKDAYRKVRLQH